MRSRAAEVAPNTTDGMTKALVTKTTASQRAKAEPLFNAIVARTKERQDRRVQ